MPGKLACGGVCQICTSRSGSSNGSGRSNTAFTTLKMAVFAPIPRARVSTTINVKPGFFASIRKLYRKSSQSVCIASSLTRNECALYCVHSPPKNLFCASADFFAYRLSQPDAVEVVPLRHVGKDHFVPGLQATEHFDRVHRCATQFHVDANGFTAIVNQLEDADRAVGLTVYRASYIKNVLQVFDFHRAIYAQIRPRTQRQRIVDSNIYCHRAVLHGRIDTRNM